MLASHEGAGSEGTETISPTPRSRPESPTTAATATAHAKAVHAAVQGGRMTTNDLKADEWYHQSSSSHDEAEHALEEEADQDQERAADDCPDPITVSPRRPGVDRLGLDQVRIEFDGRDGGGESQVDD